MKIIEIENISQIFAGEYLYYEPTGQLVLCGGINKEDETIKVMLNGKPLTAPLSHFRKMQMTRDEQRARRKSWCKGCGSR